MAPNDDVEELEVQSNTKRANSTSMDQHDSGPEGFADVLPAGEEKLPPSSFTLRRRRRYRLIAIASLLAVAFIAIAYWAASVSNVERRNNEIPTIVSSVLFERTCDQIRQEARTSLHIQNFPVTDEMVSNISDLQQLSKLVFDKGAVTDKSMEIIASLPDLQHLRLRLSPITDDGLRTLSKSESLWFLNLPHSEVTAAGVAELQSIRSLRQLRLGSPNLGNEVTREIAKFPSLRGIHLIGVPVTDEGLKTLAEMPYLETLYLDDSAVTQAGWDWLFREHSNLHVHVNQNHLDRDPKRHRHH
ncbi:MAG: hypothetical protein GY904_30860 [Planctomycetaceae bacterium]|nr:hypothetical protein [Planctomycetaceae bacterium]